MRTWHRLCAYANHRAWLVAPLVPLDFLAIVGMSIGVTFMAGPAPACASVNMGQEALAKWRECVREIFPEHISDFLPDLLPIAVVSDWL